MHRIFSCTIDQNSLFICRGGNYTTPGTGDVGSYISAFTYQGCLPVSRTSFSQKSGTEVLSFFDITVGIRDPNVFIPRRECLSDYEWENRYTLFSVPSKKF